MIEQFQYYMLVDINSFFASVEELIDKRLQGKPVAVTRKNTVIATNYAAKGKGIQAGMLKEIVEDLFPDVVFVKENFRLYERISERIFNFCREYGRLIPVSIDEFYLTGIARDWSEVVQLAKHIKRIIRKGEGLSSSVGICYNPTLAKLACDLAKPYEIYAKPAGILTITEEYVEQVVYPLEVRMLSGIGKERADKLKDIGIRTIGEFSRASYWQRDAFDLVLKRLYKDVQRPIYKQGAFDFFYDEKLFYNLKF